MGKKIKQKGLKYQTNKYTYDFKQFEKIRFFGDNIYTGKVNIDEAEMNQSNLLENVVKFNNNSRPKSKEHREKRDIYESTYGFHEGRKLTLSAFKNRIFQIKATQDEELKRLTPKQMLQRLPISLAKVKVANTSENSLNEISQIIYSLYQPKEITKKVYNNFMNSIKI